MWWLVSAGVLALFVSLCVYCGIFRSTEWMDFKSATIQLYKYWAQNPDRADLPMQLQGVFWMSDNPGNELTLTLWGGVLDKQKRTVSFYPGGGLCCACSSKQMWTYGSSLSGRLVYLYDRALVIRYKFCFNEDYSFAEIKQYFFGYILMPSCIMYFEMTQADRTGDLWYRKSTIFGRPLAAGTYSLKRVIAPDGQKIPAFAEMVKSVDSGEFDKSKVQGIPLPLFAQSDAREGLHEEFETEHAETQRLLDQQPGGCMPCSK